MGHYTDITSQRQLTALAKDQMVYVRVEAPGGAIRLRITGRSISDMLRAAKTNPFTKLTGYAPEEGFLYLSLLADSAALAKADKPPVQPRPHKTEQKRSSRSTTAGITSRILRETYRAVRKCAAKFEKCPVTGFNHPCRLDNHHHGHITLETMAQAGSHTILAKALMRTKGWLMTGDIYYYDDGSVMIWDKSADARTRSPNEVCWAMTTTTELADAALLFDESRGKAPVTYASYQCLDRRCTATTVARLTGGHGLPMNIKTECPNCGPTNQPLVKSATRQEWNDSQNRVDIMRPERGTQWHRG